MISHPKIALSAAIVLSATNALYGQQMSTPPPAPAPSPGLINEWFRQRDPNNISWDLGGQVRLRFEDKSYFATAGIPGAIDFRANGNSQNAYLLLREKIHLGYNAPSWSIFVEGRDSSAQWDERKPTPDSDMLDLHQAYFTLGNKKESALSLKAGRQEMAYGDERLIGASDWTNVERTFDAVKVRYENKSFWADAFVSRPVIVDNHNFS